MHVVLETQRLTLRKFTEDDVGNLFDLNADPQVMRYLTGGRPTPVEELRDEVIPFHLAVYERLDRLGTWAAESSATGEFLGWFHFRPGNGTDITDIDLGYRLRRAAWNMGHATEGSRALINMGFTELGIQRVFGHTMTVRCLPARDGEVRPDTGAHHAVRKARRHRRLRARRSRVRANQARMGRTRGWRCSRRLTAVLEGSKVLTP